MIDLVTLYHSIINTKKGKRNLQNTSTSQNSAGCVGFRYDEKDLIDYKIIILIKKGKMKFQLDKIGTLGVWFAALSCPVCFPALGVLVSLLGLGFLSAFEVIAITVLLPMFASIVLLISLYDWYQHRNHLRGILSASSPTLILLILYPLWKYSWSTYMFYGAISLMLVVSVLDIVKPVRIQCKI